MEQYTVFNSDNLCRHGHNTYIYLDNSVLCRSCIHKEILDHGIFIRNEPECFSKDIDNSIVDWMKYYEYSEDDNVLFEFIKDGLARKIFHELFPERHDNEAYCQKCGDKFYHGKCQCDEKLPHCG